MNDMREIYELCTFVLSWMIVHKTSNMPADVYDDICGDLRNEVSKELHKWPQCYMASGRLYTIKLDDAKCLLDKYRIILGE